MNKYIVALAVEKIQTFLKVVIHFHVQRNLYNKGNFYQF